MMDFEEATPDTKIAIRLGDFDKMRVDLTAARERIEELEAALQETIERVKQWHRISYSARYRQLIEECREALGDE